MPSFTKEQKALAAKKFRAWLTREGRNIHEACRFMGIGRSQKIYEFVNHGIASSATVVKVLELIGIPPGALKYLHTSKRIRGRLSRPRRFPVVIFCTEEHLAILGDLVDALHASKGKKRAAGLRNKCTVVGNLVGHHLTTRYRDSDQLRRAALYRRMQDTFRWVTGGSALGGVAMMGIKSRRKRDHRGKALTRKKVPGLPG